MELQVIQSKIYEIRGSRVMLDFDLAKLYSTETSLLKRAFRRNMERFPEDSKLAHPNITLVPMLLLLLQNKV